jgi:hypothetical protein
MHTESVVVVLVDVVWCVVVFVEVVELVEDVAHNSGA